MISQLFFSLIAIALLALLVVQGRRRRIWSFLLLAACGFLMYELLLSFREDAFSSFVYQWGGFQNLQFSLHLSGTPEIDKILLSLLGSAVGLVYLNSVYWGENHKLTVNTAVLLNVAAFILLLCSKDFVQLMVGSSCLAILGFYLIPDMESKRKFIFYGFLSEMALFTALAVVYDVIPSMNLQEAERFSTIGRHKDLVALLVLLCVFCQAGMLGFQNYILDLQTLTFNRIMIFCLTSLPLSSLVIFTKLRPLLAASQYTEPVLSIWLSATAVWCLVAMLLTDSLKAAAIYLNLLFYAFSLAFLGVCPDGLDRVINFFPAAILLNVLLMMVNNAASNELYVSRLGGLARHIRFTFVLALAGIAVFIGSFLNVPAAAEKIAFIYLAVVLTGLSSIMSRVFLGRANADDKVMALLKNPSPLYWLPLIGVFVWLGWAYSFWQNKMFYAFFGAFVLLLLIAPFRFCGRWSDDEDVQEADWFNDLYQIVILAPLRLLGRVLWILVDFIVIERSIIGSVAQTSNFLVSGLQKLQGSVRLSYLLMIALGLAVLLLNMGYKYYE